MGIQDGPANAEPRAPERGPLEDFAGGDWLPPGVAATTRLVRISTCSASALVSETPSSPPPHAPTRSLLTRVTTAALRMSGPSTNEHDPARSVSSRQRKVGKDACPARHRSASVRSTKVFYQDAA